MFDIDKLITDPYNRKARLQPALFALLPVIAGFLVFIRLTGSSVIAVGSTLLSCGALIWLSQMGRDRGKALEPQLFESWGGKPSVVLLRHSDVSIDSVTKTRYHKFLDKSVPNLSLPTREREMEAPEEADAKYESATNWLLARTRDKQKFRLIFEENTNYGFRRNTYALKNMALLSDFLVFLVLLGRIIQHLMGAAEFDLDLFLQTDLVVILLTVTHACVFAFLISQDWVRLPAEAYGKQLLAACDVGSLDS